MGTAMMNVSMVFAQLERETIAERIRDNMLMLARTGRWLGGTPPLGYDSQQVSSIDEFGKALTAHTDLPFITERNRIQRESGQAAIRPPNGLLQWESTSL